ncbi:hypothetical protein EJ08DRAFT_648836 [Tothia fuscella]|uniref:Uncharacterized protein n=1 Tax=Tothia fuscella TaxID=1048955 RepID=A0A9P4NUM5_9PEZI|nr:hypothetical protein EJ08DRAFT_648836 [Tothia fuscella]
MVKEVKAVKEVKEVKTRSGKSGRKRKGKNKKLLISRRAFMLEKLEIVPPTKEEVKPPSSPTSLRFSAMNIGSGKGHRYLRLIEMARERSGRESVKVKEKMPSIAKRERESSEFVGLSDVGSSRKRFKIEEDLCIKREQDWSEIGGLQPLSGCHHIKSEEF